MRAIVTDTARRVVANLPALLVFFLAGWAANYLLVRLAGYVAATVDPLYGQLLLPLAVLVRIASYVAMFLVLRPGKHFLDALGTSILPFLAVFAAWGMLHEDWVAFSLAQLENRGDSDIPLFIELTPLTIAVAAAAFALRFVLGRYRDRLPRWFGFVSAYLEAVWLFIAVDVISQIVGLVAAWVQTRQVVVWYNELVAAAREVFAPVGWVADAVSWLLYQATIVLGVPLAWLTLAGIVYAVTVARSGPNKRVAMIGRRLARLPRSLRRRLDEVGADLAGRWMPVSTSVRLLWAGGIVAIGVFVLAYAVLDTSSAWLRFGIVRLLGPHDLEWWFATDMLVSLVIDAIVEPLRISLVAAAWGYFLLRSSAGREELDRERHATELQVEDKEIGQRSRV